MRSLTKIVACMWALTLMATPAHAEYEAGMAAYERGDYAGAFAELLPAAEAGDYLAQYYVGVMLQTGQGTEQDAAAAARWLRASTEGTIDAWQRELDSCHGQLQTQYEYINQLTETLDQIRRTIGDGYHYR